MTTMPRIPRQTIHRRLVEYFQLQTVTTRSSLEILHGLERMGDRARLEGVLADIDRFLPLWHDSTRNLVLRLWSDRDAGRVVDAYRSSLASWRARGVVAIDRHIDVLSALAALQQAVGNWSESEALRREQLVLLRSADRRAGAGRVLAELSNLARNLGRIDEAMRLAHEAESAARSCGDRTGVADAVGMRGHLHHGRGQFDQALECYRLREEIADELGDRKAVAQALGNQGIVHADCDRMDDALACYRRCERLLREVGDRRGIAMTMGARGIVHANRGEYPQALECYREQERIGRELGDRQVIAVAVGNRGIVHFERGERSEALACYREQERIGRELGDRAGLGMAMGRQGYVHDEQGDYGEALACFARGEAEHRAIGFLYGLSFWLQGTTSVLLNLLESRAPMPEYLPRFVEGATGKNWRTAGLDTARRYVEECIAIGEELSTPDTVATGRRLLERITALERSGFEPVATPGPVRRTEVHARIARYFAGVPFGRRTARELIWQYSATEDVPAVVDVVRRPSTVSCMATGETMQDLLRTWSWLAGRGVEACEVYAHVLHESPSDDRGEESSAEVAALAGLLRQLQCSRLAVELFTRLHQIGVERQDPASTFRGAMGLGSTHQQMGLYDEAEGFHREALDIAVRTDHPAWRVQAALGLSSVHGYRNEFDEARRFAELALNSAELNDDPRSRAIALRNLGLLHYFRQEYDESLEVSRRCLALVVALGDRVSEASVLGNIGVVLKKTEQYEEALEAYTSQAAIAAELGDDCNLGLAIGARGNVLVELRRYEDAFAAFVEAVRIHEAIEFRYGLAFWYQGLAFLHLEWLEHEFCPPFILESLEPEERGAWRSSIARKAGRYAQQCLDIGTALSQRVLQTTSRLYLARVDAELGDVASAIRRLEALRQESPDGVTLTEIDRCLHTWRRSHPDG